MPETKMTLRPRLALDGQWYFSPTEMPNNDNGSLMTVSAPWQADPCFRDYSGEACYQHKFDIPAEWLSPDRMIFIGFGFLDYFAEVWLRVHIKVPDPRYYAAADRVGLLIWKSCQIIIC